MQRSITLVPNGNNPTLTVSGTAFKVDQSGMVTFVAGQTFPGGGGTITGVTAGTGLTGGGTSGTVTLNVDTTKVPLLTTTNTFNGSQNVTGNVSVSGTVEVDSGGTNTGSDLPGIQFGASNSGETISSKRNSGGNQYGLDFYTGYNVRMSVTNSGNVGIGENNPGHMLEIVAGGTTYADAWTTRSSRRWKTNIQTLEGALEKVEQLRGVSYDLKANGKHQIGVIAEEVGAVLPEIVEWDKNGKDANGVDYSRLTALLIEATKEQQALIHKQQEQIRAQQAQITRLTRQVRVIQTSLNTNGRTGAEVRTVKAKMPVAQQ